MEYSQYLFILFAYLIGSIPSSYWVGKFFYKIDIREHGSGNAGATNTFRVLGKKAGIPVLIFDVFKGWFAVFIFSNQVSAETLFTSIENYKLLLAITAVLGHIYPVFAGFRGGKGVAVMLGVVVALLPYAACCAALVFLLTLIISNYVSLSSMLAGILFPVFTVFIFHVKSESMIIFSMIVPILLIYTHRKNISRLLKKEENKTYLFGNNSK